MRKLLPILTFAALLILPAGFLATNGCSTTAQKAVFNTVSGTQTTVDAAMTAWGNYVQQFNPPDSQRAQVKAAYDKYQAAALAVIDAEAAIAAQANAAGTNASLGLSAVLQAAQTGAQASLTDLVALLKQFGVTGI